VTYEELRRILDHLVNGAEWDAKAALARLPARDRQALGRLTGTVSRLAAEVGDLPPPPPVPCRDALLAALAELENRP